MPIYSIDKAHVSYAIGVDLTDFRNGDVALTAGEVQATDLLDTKYNRLPVDYTDPETAEAGHMSAAQYPTRYTTGNKIGSITLPMYLQTGMPLYATLGTCVTTGTYSHAISLNTSQTPINFALHFEKELASKDIRYDFLGFMPSMWNLSCGDDAARWKAKQRLDARFALTKSGVTDISEPAKQALDKYEWNDLKHASGLLTFEYNGSPLEFDARAFDFTVNRINPLWGARDADGYPPSASISGVNFDLLLEGYLTGDNVRALMATKPEDYVGTLLDGEIKFYKSATREYGISIANMYLIPDETVLDETEWYEKKTLRFVPYNHTTSISAVVDDSLDKTYYEND